MKRYFLLLLLIGVGCTSDLDRIQGEWKMREHQSYSYSSPMGKDFIPFTFMKVSSDSIWIDSVYSKITIEKEGISFKIFNQDQSFMVSEGSKNESHIYLSSKTFTPKNKVQSYYFFTRIR